MSIIGWIVAGVIIIFLLGVSIWSIRHLPKDGEMTAEEKQALSQSFLQDQRPFL